jgi:NAD(P)-dependent dehydrogenase (short-subunit alcohol dehydrogenase family)
MTARSGDRDEPRCEGFRAGHRRPIYADRLAKRGHDLILVARSVDRLRRLADKIGGETGRRVEVIAADLGKRKDLAKGRDRAEDRQADHHPRQQCQRRFDCSPSAGRG